MVNSPHWLEENIFSPLTNLCLPLQGQSEDFWNIYSLQSQTQPSRQARKGRDQHSWRPARCWGLCPLPQGSGSPSLESSIIPFPTLLVRKFRHAEVKELGQALLAIQ